MWQHIVGRFLETHCYSEPGKVRHLESLVTTGIDARKRLEVGIDVECHAVKARAAPNPETHAGNLPASDVDARRVGARQRIDVAFSQQIDNALLERRHELAHADAGALEVDQRVDHEDAGAMVGDLAAAIDLYDRDIAGRKHVFLARVQAQGKYGRVLAEPGRIGRCCVTPLGKCLHLPPQGYVVLPAEEARPHSA